MQNKTRWDEGDEFPTWAIVIAIIILLIGAVIMGVGVWALVELVQWVTSK